MNMFEDIDKVKKDLPKIKNVADDVSKVDLNIYQKISIVIFVICLFLGFYFGNLFPSCSSTSEFFSNACLTTEFNFSLMLSIWFFSFLLFLFFFMVGHIIKVLESINNQLKKK